MFDTEFRAASDTGLVDAIEESAAAESRAAARRLAAIAELVRRRCADGDRALWACDAWDAAAAEVSAALGVSHGRASGQMHLAESLRTRLPRLAALFLAGRVDARVVAAISWRTNLVVDDDAMAVIDAGLADQAGNFGALSQYKLEQAIDAWIDRHDPGALRRTRAGAQSRNVTFGARNHESGTAAFWGRLYGTDAAVVDRRLEQMAGAVCDHDPRTVSQRRADALGALAAGSLVLSCRCGAKDCPTAGPDGRAASVLIHVLADSEALGSQPDPLMSGDDCPATEPAVRAAGSAVIAGAGIVPAPLLAELIREGAKVRQTRKPPDGPEPGYRPSTALAEFVRTRDLSCRFPNCDRPAQYCDLDHAIPWPFGPTHASDLRALCRKHHLLKTFWAGDRGWRDRQSPDGTIVWTAPTGHTYTTRPASRLLFPAWDSTTPAPPMRDACAVGDSGVMMPTRRRTRAADRACRIARERSLNDSYVAERNKPPPF